MNEVYVGVFSGVGFRDPDSEAMEPYLGSEMGGVTMEGSIPYIQLLDTAFDDGFCQPLASAGDGIYALFKIGAFRVSQRVGMVPLLV